MPEAPLDKLGKSIRRAQEMLDDLCAGAVRWRMSIPVRDDDPDIVLSIGLAAGESALKRAEAAEAKLAAVPWLAIEHICGPVQLAGVTLAARDLYEWLESAQPQPAPGPCPYCLAPKEDSHD